MYKLFAHIITVIITGVLCCCGGGDDRTALLNKLNEIVDSQEAEIGVAVIVDGQDIIVVNGDRRFQMFSVYKFPIALAYDAFCRENGLSADDWCVIRIQDLEVNTYSPMLRLFAEADSVVLTRGQIVDYAMRVSDNNASDIMLAQMGGTSYVDSYLKRSGIGDIAVVHTEAEMYRDHSLSKDNSATPVAIARLFDGFVAEYDGPTSIDLRSIMESCATGTDRLAAGIGDEAVAFGHKTGSGFTLPDGYDVAVNDAGYVLLPDGHRYTIAVFIENRPGIKPADGSVIARISEAVYQYAVDRD